VDRRCLTDIVGERGRRDRGRVVLSSNSLLNGAGGHVMTVARRAGMEAWLSRQRDSETARLPSRSGCTPIARRLAYHAPPAQGLVAAGVSRWGGGKSGPVPRSSSSPVEPLTTRAARPSWPQAASSTHAWPSRALFTVSLGPRVLLNSRDEPR
jgi:hypothetical protein